MTATCKVLRFMGLLGLLLAFQLHAADWVQFRGPGGSGISSEKGLPETWSAKENLVWKTELPGAGTSSPVLIGKRIFLTCYSGYNVPGQPKGDQESLRRHLVCLDRKSGEIVWKKEVPTKLPELRGLRESHGYASSTPAVDDERVYCFFGKSGVFAFDHEGKQLWEADVGSRLHDNWGSATSPILHGNLVIINASVESNALVALDRKTGKEIWRSRGINDSWNTPVLVAVGGKTELVVSITGKILAFDPENGKSLWTCNSGINTYMSPSLVAADGIVYCVGGRTNGSTAVKAGGEGDVTETHRLWTSTKGTNVPSPIYYEGHLYYGHDGRETVLCADAKTGKIVYDERLPRAGQLYASPVLADGKLYYVARDGKTFVLPAKPEFKILATNDLRDRSLFSASPAVADGRLFIRSDKYLYCVGKQ